MFADDTNISSHGANIREINENLNENLEKYINGYFPINSH